MKRISSKFRHLMRSSQSSSSSSNLASSASEDLKPPAKPQGKPPQLNAPLENLPPEIRRLLLSFLRLEELRALVFASPVFHQQYLLDRRYLLSKSLETTLLHNSITVDACAVYQSGLSSFQDTVTAENVTQFLQSYRQRRSSPQYSILTDQDRSDDQVIDIAAFHSAIINPLAQRYAAWTLANLANETGLQSPEPLSKTEEIRVLRALYRFQLCCNLFGGHKNPGEARVSFRSVDILKIFICIFEPWQVEEIACIYTFVQEKYDQIFRDISWDVDEKNPKFDGQRPPTPVGAFHFDNSWARQTLLAGTISLGLELVHAVLFKIKDDHEQLVSTMQQRISWPRGHFLRDEALGETAQWERRQERMSEGDRKQLRRDPLPFNGDDDGGLHPPLAWTLIWGGTYSNLYGYYVQDVIRRWGYVMWDASRLERTGAKELLMRQWEEDWGDSDPRDNLL